MARVARVKEVRKVARQELKLGKGTRDRLCGILWTIVMILTFILKEMINSIRSFEGVNDMIFDLSFKR